MLDGCESEALTIDISIIACDIDLPTAFTPNNDGMNDAWEIPNLDIIYPNNKVYIYNRWGALLYETEQGKYNEQPWDGTYKGALLPVASYFFIIDTDIELTDAKKINGAVSIVNE